MDPIANSQQPRAVESTKRLESRPNPNALRGSVQYSDMRLEYGFQKFSDIASRKSRNRAASPDKGSAIESKTSAG